MSVVPSGLQIRQADYGPIVTGAAKSIPQTGSQDIFTVVNGRVLVTSLVGVVSTVIGGTVTTLSVGVQPTGGSRVTTKLCTAVAITSLALGAMVAVPNLITGALVVGDASGVMAGGSSGGTGVPVRSGGIAVVSTGTIGVTTSANNTGAIVWSVTYVPYDSGAAITAL